MSLSVFDLFKVGIGPSSSHTVGPMVAAGRFVRELVSSGVRPKVSSVRCDVYGSLALTGEGHATDKAIVLGLLGETPAEVDPDVAQKLAVEFYFNNPSRDWSPGQPLPETKLFPLFGGEPIQFRGKGTGILWHYDVTLPRHPNALRLTALDASDKELLQRTYYSVGGGFDMQIGGALIDSAVEQVIDKLDDVNADISHGWRGWHGDLMAFPNECESNVVGSGDSASSTVW